MKKYYIFVVFIFLCTHVFAHKYNPIDKRKNYNNSDAYKAKLPIHKRFYFEQKNFISSDFTIEEKPVSLGTFPIKTPDDLYLCDDGDGLVKFFLDTQKDSEILDGLSPLDYKVSYHNTQADADAGISALAIPYENASAYTTETIYVRVEEDADPTNYETTSFSIGIVEMTINSGGVPSMNLCDNESSGTIDDDFVVFDLTENETYILNGLTASNYTFEYYKDNGYTEQIASPNAYVNITTSEPIFVKVISNLNNSCEGSSTFNINVVSTQKVPIELSSCDSNGDGNEMFNLSDAVSLFVPDPNTVTVRYYESMSNLKDGINNINPANYNASDGTEIFILASGNNCHAIGELTLNVSAVPTVQDVNDIEYCDDDGTPSDGVLSSIDFSSQETEVLGSLNASEYNVTFHGTAVDAQNDTGALGNPYTNTSASETIYIRVENIASGCADTSKSFNLQVHANTNSFNFADYELCDDDANKNNGQTDFDLVNTHANVITNGDFLSFNISFYKSQSDAENETNEITDSVYENETLNQETIFVRIEDKTTGCLLEIGSFDLIVNPVPDINSGVPSSLTLCDDDNDGFMDFDIHSLSTDVLSGLDTNIYSVSYHTNIVMAESNLNPIPDAPYTNTSPNVDSVVIRLENTDTGCVDYDFVILRVNPKPVFTLDTEAFLCPDGSLLVEPDVQSANVTYRWLKDSNLISVSKDLIVTEIGIYELEVKTNSNCIETKSIEIKSHPAIEITTIPAIEVCDDDNDGLAIFDLTSHLAAIEGNYAPGLYTIKAYKDASHALNDVSEITDSNYQNATVNSMTVYTKIINNTTGCENHDVTFDLIVNPYPIIPAVTDLALCDDDTDGLVSGFNLQEHDATILNGLTNHNVTYHTTQSDADNDTSPIASPANFTNTSNPQTIYIRLENNPTECYNTSTFELSVNALPTFTIDSPQNMCSGEDITLSPTNVSDAGATFEWFDSGLNSLGTTQDLTVSTIGDYTITVTDTNGCSTSETVTVNLHPAISVNSIPDMEVCDDDNDGFWIFDLTAHLNGFGGSDYTIKAYESLNDAQNDTNEITSDSYQNTVSDTQTIYTNITHNTTGCSRTDLTFDLIIKESPEVFDLPTLQLCDDDTDGIVSGFNIGSQTPLVIHGGYVVTYHYSENGALNNTDPIFGSLSNFTNTIPNQQTLYIRVVNTIVGCTSVYEFDVIVHPLPTFDLDSSQNICPNGSLTLSPDNLSDPSATFEWTDSNSNSLGTNQNLTVNTVGDYTFTMTDSNGCVSSETVTVTEFPPIAITTIPNIEVCDDDTDGFAVFDIEAHLDAIEGNYALGEYSIKAYPTQVDLQNDTNEITNNNAYTNATINSQTIYTNITNNTTGCIEEDVTFDIIVNPLPVIAAIPDLELCDDDYDGFVSGFNLQNQDALILNGLTDHDVTYHETQADAENDTNPIVDVTNFTNTANPQTIFIRLENDPTGCSITGSFDLIVNPLPNFDLDTPQTLCFGESIVLEPTNIVGTNLSYEWFDSNSNSLGTNQNLTVNTAGDYTLTVSNLNCSVSQTVTVLETMPITITIPDLEICDDDTDGFASFDLTNHIDNVLGNFNPNEYTIKLYTNLNDAQNETNEIISNPFTNQTANSQTIYTSITNNDTNCTISSVTFDLIVNPLPIIVSVPDLELCDDDDDGIVSTFDIHSLSGFILNGLTDHNVTFHLTQADAQNDVNPIPVGNFTNTTNPQTIYIRLENNPTNCTSIGNFDLIVNPLPEFDVITPQQICPNATVTLSADNVSSPNPIYEWFDENNNSIGNSATVTVSQEGDYTVTVRNAFDCQTSQTITVIESNDIALQVIPDMNACYDNSDDATDFDLKSHIDDVLLGFAVNEFTVKVYETQTDAINDTNEIDTNNLYTVNGQNSVTIYTNITNNNTGCIVTDITFDLIIDPLPDIPNLDPITLCDDDNDGFMDFDIHSQTAIIFQTLDSNLHTITYHETLADAQNNVNALPNGNYTNTSNPQTIYIRVENTNTNCFDTVTFDLNVNDSPLFTIPSPQNICPGETLLLGPNTVFGGGTTFEWTDGNSNVLGNSQMLNVTDAGDYTLTVTNNDGCIYTQTITIIMLDEVAISTLPNIEVCDDDSDGFVNFDLTNHVNSVLANYNNGEYTITLFESQIDAQNNTNPITTNPYINTVINQQTIYTNITNNNTNCYVTDVTFDLIVNPLPVIPNLDPISLCDDDNDGFMDFDIHAQTAIIFQTLDSNLHTITYHETLTDAENNTNAILNGNYTNTSNPQTIYIRVENTDTNCFDTTTFDINVNDSPLFTLFSPQELCPGTILTLNPDGIFTGNTTFEWSDINGNILATTQTLDVTDAGNYTLTVTNEDGCIYAQSTTVNMLDEVAITTIPNLEVCDDDTDGFANFDLTNHVNSILTNYNNGEYTITLHETIADAENNVNAITGNPYINTTINQQTIFTNITNNLTGCFVTNVSFEIIVNPLPVPISLPNMTTCDNDLDGDNANGIVQDFNVHQNSSFIYANLDPNDYEVSYHETLADAEGDFNPIPTGNYTNTSNPQTIFIRIENLNSGCYDVSETFELFVESALTYDVDTPQQFCSNETITLSPYNLSDNNVAFEWFDESGNSLATTQDYTTSTPGNYTITISRPNCEVSKIITVEHHPEIQITALPDLLECDDDYDGIGSFDLKTHIDSYLNANYPNGEYTMDLFTNQNDADSNTNPIDLNNPFINTTLTNQIIYTNILDTNTGCSSTDVTFSVIVQEITTIPAISNLELCDDDNDGFMNLFDIHSVTTTDLVSLTNHSISYHESENDAQNNSNPIAAGNYTNIVSENQTIWVRVEDNTNNCPAYSSFELFVHKFVEFDLVDEETLCPFSFTTLKVENVSESGVTYEWLDENNTVIGNTDTVTVSDEGTFSVTVSNGNCSNTKEILVRRLADLEITSIPDLLECDDDYDGIANFDLNTHIQNVVSNYAANQYSITLFTSQNDAINEVNPIDINNPFTNTTATNQIIFTKILDNTTGCYNTDVSFSVVVQEIPTIPTISNLELCDDDNDGFMNSFDVHSVTTTDLASLTNHSISYHESENDAQNNSNPIAVGNYTNTVAQNQTIWVRVEDNTNNCSAYSSFELIVNEIVEFDIVGDDKLCQDSFVTLQAANVSETGVTYEWFDVTGNSIGNSETIDVTQIGIYTLTVTNQNCSNSKTFEITAHPLVQITSLPDMFECDDDYDGISNFDLKSHIDTYLNINYPNGEYTIDLYTSQNDAENTTNPIDLNNLFTNSTTTNQTIFTNILDTNTGCSSTDVTFSVIVQEIPTIPTISNLELCDDDNDGFMNLFDVHSVTTTDLASLTNHSISYHESENDAQNNSNPIAVGNYTNIVAQNQTIWVRVEDNTNNCPAYSSFELIVNEIVEFDIVGDDKLCQDSFVTLQAANVSETGVMYEWFDVTGNSIGNSETIDVTQIGIYTLTVTNQNCSNSKTFEITAHPEIAMTAIPDMFVCDDDYDGMMSFDLQNHMQTVLANYPVNQYSVFMYTSQNNADNNIVPMDLNTLYTNIIPNSQTIYTRIIDNQTGCFNTDVTFNLNVREIPVMPIMTNMEMCDDDNDGFMSLFDIHSKTNTDLTSMSNHTISYHESESDARNNTSAIPIGNYTNIIPQNQTIWVRAVDNSNGCPAYTTFDLVVREYVDFEMEENQLLCPNSTLILEPLNVSDTNATYIWYDQVNTIVGTDSTLEVSQAGTYTLVVRNQFCENRKVIRVELADEIPFTAIPDMENCDEDGDGFAQFSITNHIGFLLQENGIENHFANIYPTQVDAENNTNQIFATQYTNATPDFETLFVVVTNPATNCSTPIIPFNLHVYDMPKVPNFPDLEACDDDTDGIQTFDLHEHDGIIAAGINLTTHNITYHISSEEAENGSNPIAIGNYTNTIPHAQELFIRVESIENGCANTERSFMLIVNPLPDFELDSPQYICEGFDHVLNASIENPGGYTYQWMDENGANIGDSQAIYVQNAGMYAVTVISASGCESSKIVELIPIVVPEVTKADLEINGNSVTVNVQNESDTGFEFSLDEVDGNYQTEPYFEHVTAGDHVIYVRNQEGCSTISLPFSIMGFPQYFTPNDDGMHDYWQVTGFDTDQFSSNKVIIYDRFGKVISQFNIKSKGWDGTYNGLELPSSDYWFTINLVTREGEEINYKGHFSLIRR
ncbi:T9SS type B sorting domain-containing protein [Aureivirga marina]|uniref:T9SS type B sorting domain-containing protein n=1 Tax=Aureivirga marina TaxID=1182451 RepID=UPI0018C8EA8D|nr:T9SS type B sorting domain-containing protein [Aureivirga marina]